MRGCIGSCWLAFTFTALLMNSVSAIPSPSSSTVLPPISMNPSTRRWIETTTGRERYWHGVNVVYKGIPYHPVTESFNATQSYSTADMAILQSLGLNIIRLGAMWAGVEPVRGEYNRTYLEVLKWIVSTNAEFGIWSILDFHQDLLSERYCGEGVPRWAAQPRPTATGFPYPLHEPYPVDNNTGFPSVQDCNRFGWPEYQFTEQSASAYQTLYTNAYGGVRDSFVAYWRELASTFQSVPGVVAYELMNEPWSGDVFEDPRLMIPGVADRKYLQPFYEIVHDAIRTVDDNTVLLFAGVTWDDLGVGFNDTPGGELYKDRTALAYHFYLPPQLSLAGTFKVRQEDFMRLGVGGMLTEFDISQGGCCTLTTETMDTADAYFQSWLGWEYKTFDPITGYGNGLWNLDGSFNETVARVMARTYPQAVAGDTTLIQFNATGSDAGVFMLQYRTSSRITAAGSATDIFLHELYHYPNGYTVNIEPSDVATWTSPATNAIQIVNAPNVPIGITITVTIRPQ